MVEKSHYILLNSHTEGFELFYYLKAEGFAPRIAPVPPVAKAGCGMSLLVDAHEIEDVEKSIQTKKHLFDRVVALDNQIDAKRDKFC